MIDELTTANWSRYPFALVSGDKLLDFPAAEGNHLDHESDTWFLAGQLSAAATGRAFAFLTIFNKNRPGQSVVADFYTMALFDLDTGEYGTYTDYDMPPGNLGNHSPKLSSATGHLDIGYHSGAGTAVWTTCRDANAALLPYTYRVSLIGCDQTGRPMQLDLDVTPTRAPVPLGASRYNGKIACFGQHDTYSYFQTGMAMTGTLRWGATCEQVSGPAGHVDRQWFPRYAGGGGTGGDPRARSHEWCTINLDNGIDLSIWRQFDRTSGNALQPFSGVTTSHPDPAVPPECADDVEISGYDYVQWPDTMRPLVPPLAKARFLPNRHRISCASLQLELFADPLVAVPAHALPIEYMEGPCRYRGTLHGKPVSGFGLYERSLVLYRDWELVDVLAAAVAELQTPAEQLTSLVEQVGVLTVSGRRGEALQVLRTQVRRAVQRLPAGRRERVAAVVEALVSALVEGGC